MPEALIVAATRTPIGRARKGSLVTKDAFQLAEVAVRGVLERSKIDPKEIDDLVIAESLQGGGVIARHTAVVVGLENVPGIAGLGTAAQRAVQKMRDESERLAGLRDRLEQGILASVPGAERNGAATGISCCP